LPLKQKIRHVSDQYQHSHEKPWYKKWVCRTKTYDCFRTLAAAATAAAAAAAAYDDVATKLRYTEACIVSGRHMSATNDRSLTLYDLAQRLLARSAAHLTPQFCQ